MSERRIVIERTLAAPIERVFAAWADAASMGSWMCPAPTMRAATVELDFRVGGRFRITMHGENGDFVQHGEYLEIEPPRRVVMLWNTEWVPEAERRTILRIDLQPAGRRRTRLVLTHEALPAGESYAGHAGGWTEILRRLAEQLETGEIACR